MPATQRTQTSKLTSNGVYIILIVVLTILAVSGSILIHRFGYVGGTRNDAHYCFVYGLLTFLISFSLMALVAASASILVIISLAIKHGSFGQIFLKLTMILLGPVIVCCAILYTTPLSPIFLKGFEQWVRNETDIEAIQTWLASEGKIHAGKNYEGENLPEELPECLLELHPFYIKFCDSDSQDGLSVEIVWFFVMDECGLIVGPPEMETPEKGCLKIRKDYYEFRRPIKPGAYVFIRG